METVKNNRKVRLMVLALFACLLAGVWLAGTSIAAEAATSYKMMEPDGNISKAGKYYFKYSYSAGKWYISTKKKSGYKAFTATDSAIVSNGKYAFLIQYMNDEKQGLYRVTCKTKKAKLMKKLPESGELHYYNISTVYKNKIYLTRGNFPDGDLQRTYAYNTSGNSLKLLTSQFGISDRRGKYVVGFAKDDVHYQTNQLSLYKITSSGLSKVKTLAKHGYMDFGSINFVGKKLYYVAYTSSKMNKGTIYRCNYDGTGRKALKTIKTSGQFVVTEFKSKHCTILMGPGIYEMDKTYRFTYSTRKLKRID